MKGEVFGQRAAAGKLEWQGCFWGKFGTQPNSGSSGRELDRRNPSIPELLNSDVGSSDFSILSLVRPGAAAPNYTALSK